VRPGAVARTCPSGIRYRLPCRSHAAARPGDERIRLRRLFSAELTPAAIASIRTMLDAAFWGDEEERFTDDDWEHALGGVHVVLDDDGEIVSHASVVERELQVAGRPGGAG
jgi:aminoglycoside 2'-N-acetyltransferase I